MKRFDQARPFTTLALVILAWLILPTAIKALLRASFFQFTAPIDASASYVRDLQEYWSLRLHSKPELIEAGRDLARVNASYAVSVQQNAELRAEIGRLEALMHMPAPPGYRSETARVERRDFSAWWQRLVLRKGKNYGIVTGSPVVFTGGVVGRISEVHAYSSVVEMITSPNMRLAAFVDGDTHPVSFEGGDNRPMQPPRGHVEFLPLDTILLPGAPRKLLTSGLGGEFPAGLVLGDLIHVTPSTDGLFETGEVRLDPRLSELTEVTVLVPEPGETEMRAFLAFFLTLILLWAVVTQINHCLAPWHVFVEVDALFLTYAGLALPFGFAMPAALAAGLLVDANESVPFGTHVLLFAATCAALARWRDRLPQEDGLGRVASALLVNFALFFALTFLRLRVPPADLWPRLGVDLVVSQVCLVLIGPWYFALQARALAIARLRYV